MFRRPLLALAASILVCAVAVPPAEAVVGQPGTTITYKLFGGYRKQQYFPAGIAYDQKTGWFFVSDALTGLIQDSRLDWEGTGRFINGTGLEAARGMTTNNNGTLYIAKPGVLDVIDEATRVRTARFNIGGQPSQVAMSPNGNLYVTDASRGVVTEIDKQTLDTQKSGAGRPMLYTDQPVSTDIGSQGIVAPNDQTLLIADTAHEQLLRVDAATGKSAPVALDKAVGRIRGLAYSNGDLYAVDTAGGRYLHISMNADNTAGTVDEIKGDPSFDFPVSAAIAGNRLLVTNTTHNPDNWFYYRVSGILLDLGSSNRVTMQAKCLKKGRLQFGLTGSVTEVAEVTYSALSKKLFYDTGAAHTHVLSKAKAKQLRGKQITAVAMSYNGLEPLITYSVKAPSCKG